MALRIHAMAALATLSAATIPVHAETWRITPSLSVTETLTNNVALETSNVAQGDLISEVTPRVRFSGIGARASIIGDVAVPILFYARTGSENNNVYPTASIFGTVEAIERLFFIEGAISISQPYLSPFGAQPSGLTNDTNNRYTQQTYRISPYLKGTTLGNVYYELRNNSYWSNSTDTSIATNDSFTSEWIGRIDSPVAPLGWSAYFDAVDVKFSNQSSQRMNVATFGPRYAVSPQVRIALIGGYEDNQFPFTSYQGGVYGGGIEWRPTERTSLVANVEHRFFGTGFLLSFDHRTPLSVWSLSASRGITTYAQQLATATGTSSVPGLLNQLFTSRIPDPKERLEAADNFVQSQGLPTTLSTAVNSYSEQVQLENNLSASVGLLGSRNSTFVTVYYLRTEAIAGSGTALPGVLSQSVNNTQTGVNVVWSHNLTRSAKLNFTGYAYTTRAISPLVGTTNQGGIQVELRMPLSTRTTLTAGARYQSLGSNVTTDYTESALFAGLSYAFK